MLYVRARAVRAEHERGEVERNPLRPWSGSARDESGLRLVACFLGAVWLLPLNFLELLVRPLCFPVLIYVSL